MINNWWVTRPKRQLDSVPADLAAIASVALDKEWRGARSLHLELEQKLEADGLKREGERRDQGGGGARTYMAWMKSLGLIFSQASTGKAQLTLAGEELLRGKDPVLILTRQIFKYQFPSTFSISRGVRVSPRFKIRPFRFIFQLLLDPRIGHLTQDEIAKIVITEAENETDKCFEHVVSRILEFRDVGDRCLPTDFEQRYPSTRKNVGTSAAERLNDVANTIINWMKYTQLIAFSPNGELRIIPDEVANVQALALADTPFIQRWDDEEYFQRKFGVDPWHSKDIRNLTDTKTVTREAIIKANVRKAFLEIASRKPILAINAAIISEVATVSGLKDSIVENALHELYPNGAFGSFLPAYSNMAFSGRKLATDFEVATTEIFREVFHFSSRHIGPEGLTPDVLLLSDDDGYQAIIDNKAYSQYTINNDHRNRMVVNYINGIRNYSKDSRPLDFFAYIAGGFGSSIDQGIRSIADETKVPGSAVPINGFIRMIQNHLDHPYSHGDIRRIFSLNKCLTLNDIENR